MYTKSARIVARSAPVTRMPVKTLMASAMASAIEPGTSEVFGGVGIAALVGELSGTAVGCNAGATGIDAEGVFVGAAGCGFAPASAGILSTIPTRSRVESVMPFALMIVLY